MPDYPYLVILSVTDTPREPREDAVLKLVTLPIALVRAIMQRALTDPRAWRARFWRDWMRAEMKRGLLARSNVRFSGARARKMLLRMPVTRVCMWFDGSCDALEHALERAPRADGARAARRPHARPRGEVLARLRRAHVHASSPEAAAHAPAICREVAEYGIITVGGMKDMSMTELQEAIKDGGGKPKWAKAVQRLLGCNSQTQLAPVPASVPPSANLLSKVDAKTRSLRISKATPW